jgi:hypothetical protein
MFKRCGVVSVMIASVILAACGGEPVEGELPTLFVLEENIPEASTPDVSAPQESASETPSPADDIDEAPPEVEIAPDTDTPPTDEALIADDPDDDDEDFIETDFTQLVPGQDALVIGQLRAGEDDADESDALLFDEQGNALRLSLPPPLIEEYEGQLVQVGGSIEAGDDDDQRLILTANTIMELEPLFEEEEAEEDDEEFFSPDDFAEPFDMDEATLLEIELGEDLTALQAYDALVDALSEDLDDWEWVSLAGNSDTGWTLEFHWAEDDVFTIYHIDTGGSVRVSDQIPRDALPMFLDETLFPIDRARVLLDSDNALEEAAALDVPPLDFGTLLVLRAESETEINWIIEGMELIIIDATTAP